MKPVSASPTAPDRIPAPTDASTQRALRYLALGLTVGAIAVWLLRQPRVIREVWPWIVLVVAVGTAAVALRKLETWLPGQPVLPSMALAVTPRRRTLALSLLGIGLLVTSAAVWSLWHEHPGWQRGAPAWFLGLLLLMSGALLLGAVGSAAPRAATALSILPATRSIAWAEGLVFAFLLALASFLRVYRLESIPPGIFVDETNGALDALYILEGRAVSPFGTGWYGVPNAYMYFMAGIFKVFGANWQGLKLTSLIPSVLTVPAVYFLGRLVFGREVGLVAMLLMAVSRWHLTMSRWGWVEAAPPLFQILATFFLVRGLRDRRAVDYSLSGLLAGLSLYTYLNARLVVLTLVVYVLLWFATDSSGWRTSFRRSWRGLALLSVVGIATIAPLTVTYLKAPHVFVNRTAEVSVFRDIREQGSLRPLLLNLADVARFFHQIGDHQGRHNLPGEPMLDPITGLFFAVGLGYAALAWRDHRRLLLVIWLLIGLAGSYLSTNRESPQAFRTLTVVPAIALLAADSVTRATTAVSRTARERRIAVRWPRLSPHAVTALAIVVLAVPGIWESRIFFGPQATSIHVLRGFSQTETRVARDVAAALLEAKDVYLSPDFFHFSQVRFLTFGMPKPTGEKATLDDRPYRLLVPEASLPIPDEGRDVLMLLDARYWPLRGYFASFFPDADLELVEFDDGSPLYMRVAVERAQLSELQGLTQHLEFADGTEAESVVEGINLIGQAVQVTKSVWEGALRIERGAEYEFRREGGVQVFLDGEPEEGKVYLGRGLHDLLAIWNGVPGDAPGLAWREAGAEFVSIPAASLFRVDALGQGLLGTYWTNDRWEGEPLFKQVTPFLLLAWPEGVVPSTKFSARFTGSLRVIESGTYWFRVEADDGARLLIDGATIGEGMVAGRPNGFEVTLSLEPGDHPIRIDYFQSGGGSALRLLWRHQDLPFVPVPPENLIPVTP